MARAFGSYPTGRWFKSDFRYHIRPVGQEVKTPPFHGSNMGSIPVRVTNEKPLPRGAVFSLVFRFGVRSPQIALKGSFALGIQRAICAERSSDFDIPYGSHPSRRLGISSPCKARCILSALWLYIITRLACILLRLDSIRDFVALPYIPCGNDSIRLAAIFAALPRIESRLCRDFITAFSVYSPSA